MLQRKIYSILVLAAAVLLLASCMDSVEMGGSALPGPVSGQVLTKVVNNPLDADPGSLLIKLEEAPDEAMLKNLSEKGAVSVERLFNSTPGKEELERRFGMDKWYVITLDDNLDYQDVAASLTALDNVRMVEYNSYFHKASDCIVYPYLGPVEPATKADGVFNDPKLPDQWQYANHGNQTSSQKASRSPRRSDTSA